MAFWNRNRTPETGEVSAVETKAPPVPRYDIPEHTFAFEDGFAWFIAHNSRIYLERGLASLEEISTTSLAELQALIDIYDALLQRAARLDAVDKALIVGSSNKLTTHLHERRHFRDDYWDEGIYRLDDNVNPSLWGGEERIDIRWMRDPMMRFAESLPSAEAAKMVSLVQEHFRLRTSLWEEGQELKAEVEETGRNVERFHAIEALQEIELHHLPAFDEDSAQEQRALGRQQLQIQAEAIKEAYELMASPLPLSAPEEAPALPVAATAEHTGPAQEL